MKLKGMWKWSPQHQHKSPCHVHKTLQPRMRGCRATKFDRHVVAVQTVTWHIHQHKRCHWRQGLRIVWILMMPWNSDSVKSMVVRTVSNERESDVSNTRVHEHDMLNVWGRVQCARTHTRTSDVFVRVHTSEYWESWYARGRWHRDVAR